jgi:hypothetical protein
MYYDEEVINGILCHRGTPDGEWIPFTPEQLTQKYIQAKERVFELVRQDEERTLAQLSEA